MVEADGIAADDAAYGGAANVTEDIGSRELSRIPSASRPSAMSSAWDDGATRTSVTTKQPRQASRSLFP